MGRAIKVSMADREFRSMSAARKFLQGILHSYVPGDRVRDEDAVYLEALLMRHPEREQKVGEGIDHFEVIGAEFDTQCFAVFRTDGSYEDFSLHTCIDGK